MNKNTALNVNSTTKRMANDVPLILGGSPAATQPPVLHETLARWLAAEWETRWPGRPGTLLWADPDCASRVALSRIRPGRKLRQGARYLGFEPIPSGVTVPLASFYMPARRAVVTAGIGAFVFRFEHDGNPFEVVYASNYADSSDCDVVAVALVPSDQIDVFASFEQACNKAAVYLERSPKVYVIGGKANSFEPVVEWDQVILADRIKADLHADLVSFFAKGVSIYKQLNLPPFRKLLMVGPPGTGKTTLCAALAKLALHQKCVVVYVSAADNDGASFSKIHHALRIVANSRHPVLLIVEELDTYLQEEDKSQILNVLDGLEAPNNPRGALLVATTNYPEIIDERIAKRPGRIDRIIYIPPIQDEDQAVRMLQRYMGAEYRAEHRTAAARLIGQTGAFVREAAVYARMLAAHQEEIEVSLDVLQQSIRRLANQLSTGDDLMPRRPFGFQTGEPQPAGFAAVVKRS